MNNSIKSKTCSKCGKVKELSAFSKEKRVKSGLRSVCKACVAVYHQANKTAIAAQRKAFYQENKESIDAKSKTYRSTPAGKESQARADKSYRSTPKGKSAKARGGKKYNLKFPEKIAARHAVNKAIARGDLERPPTCSCCGKVCVPEGHHWCYRKEHHLDVIWLCQQCHKDLHKTLIYNPATWEYNVKHIKTLDFMRKLCYTVRVERIKHGK